MYDIHTHLYWASYDDDREAVLERARLAGVEKMLVVGTTREESKKAIALAEQYEHIFASVGIHPNEFRGANQQSVTHNSQHGAWWEDLEILIQEHRDEVVAVGECGLDYSESHGFITEAERALQSQAFVTQLQLAKKYGLSVIVHCRTTRTGEDDAYRDLLHILQEHSAELRAVILHCYMGDTEVTEEFSKLPNVYFSFTGNSTYPVKKSIEGTKDDLRETVQRVPIARIFTETDCPFLAPQSKRGQRNEPAFVVEVLETIAELQGVSATELDEQIQKNFQAVFGKR